jgi:hypothetical protein
MSDHLPDTKGMETYGHNGFRCDFDCYTARILTTLEETERILDTIDRKSAKWGRKSYFSLDEKLSDCRKGFADRVMSFGEWPSDIYGRERNVVCKLHH